MQHYYSKLVLQYRTNVISLLYGDVDNPNDHVSDRSAVQWVSYVTPRLIPWSPDLLRTDLPGGRKVPYC
jgi:hypothetical protein